MTERSPARLAWSGQSVESSRKRSCWTRSLRLNTSASSTTIQRRLGGSTLVWLRPRASHGRRCVCETLRSSTDGLIHPPLCSAERPSSKRGLSSACRPWSISWELLEHLVDHPVGVYAFHVCLEVQDDPVPQGRMSGGADVLERDVIASFEKRADLAGQNQRLRAARAGAELNKLLNHPRGVRGGRVRGRDQANRVIPHVAGDRHLANHAGDPQEGWSIADLLDVWTRG